MVGVNGNGGRVLLESFFLFCCSIVVDSNANVIEVMPSGGSHDTKRPRQSD